MKFIPLENLPTRYGTCLEAWREQKTDIIIRHDRTTHRFKKHGLSQVSKITTRASAFDRLRPLQAGRPFKSFPVIVINHDEEILGTLVAMELINILEELTVREDIRDTYGDVNRELHKLGVKYGTIGRTHGRRRKRWMYYLKIRRLIQDFGK